MGVTAMLTFLAAAAHVIVPRKTRREWMKNFICFVVGLVIACGCASSASAQTYPSRPVTIIVPFPAGGPTDTLGRILSERMRVSLGELLEQRPAVELGELLRGAEALAGAGGEHEAADQLPSPLPVDSRSKASASSSNDASELPAMNSSTNGNAARIPRVSGS